MNCRCFGLQCSIMSLSSLFSLFLPCTSSVHFCLCVPPHALLLLLLLCLVFLQAHTTTCTHKMHIAVDLDASFVACAGGCGRLLLPLVGMKRGEERERAPRVTLPAGVMRAMGCDCCGGPHPFRCALLRRCAVRLRMSFVMRVRAGHVFPERWAATTILLRLV
ncbi:hypothetical protein TcCL_Unassigned03242 [Trypanosoma cruzi]|nr:hypothetical protein TcCL_Unassigned03242 [Trypanosoma cruzi]